MRGSTPGKCSTNLKQCVETPPENAQKLLDKCYDHARDYMRFDQKTQLPGQVKKINRRYFSIDDVPKGDQFKILVIKGDKCTGKTRLLSELVARDRSRGTATLNISHLTRLAEEQSLGLGIPYRTDKDTTQLRDSIGYSLCIDSFSPINKVPLRAGD